MRAAVSHAASRAARLEVLVVGARQALEHGEDAHQRAHHAARLAAQQLQRVGVLLLRHQARARAAPSPSRTHARHARTECADVEQVTPHLYASATVTYLRLEKMMRSSALLDPARVTQAARFGQCALARSATTD